MLDVEELEYLSETNTILLPSKWKKETEGGWIMHVDITVQDKLDDENDVEGMIMCENKERSKSEIDGKSSTPNNS
jgi:pseudouridine-5'-phosphate glycosidase